MNRILALLLPLLAAAIPASAQLEVSLEIKRRVWLRGEPIEITTSIRNLTGRDLTLRDQPGNQWFGFEVLRGKDTPISPHQPDYRNDPATILANETITRTVDLLKLYPVNELGSYTLRSAIYFPELKKYITSGELKIDIGEGRTVWSKTVGVPDGLEGAGDYRDVKLITFQTPKELVVYARIEDTGTGGFLCTYPLGRLVGGATPTGEFDSSNTLYTYHLVGNGQYALSKIGVNGEWMGQTLWNSKGRSAIRRKPDGTMVVVGATRERTKVAGTEPVPKVSDRPVPLPPPQ